MTIERLRIRQEVAEDARAIACVHDLAFGGPDEAAIVERLRAGDAWLPGLSLVAELDGRVVGHVVVSRAALVAPGDTSAPETPILALGPIGVLPEFQRRGVGEALMRAVIAAAHRRPEPVIVLLGHPGYYPRFGFVRARALGIRPQSDTWPDEAWLALDLRPAGSGHPRLAGRVRYARAFGLH